MKPMEFSARVAWQRAHAWSFDGGLAVPASSSPLSVPLPMSDPAAIDPEEALVAAASSCHMLFFLSIAARRGHVVDSYEDQALGLLDKGADGRAALVGDRSMGVAKPGSPEGMRKQTASRGGYPESGSAGQLSNPRDREYPAAI